MNEIKVRFRNKSRDQCHNIYKNWVVFFTVDQNISALQKSDGEKTKLHSAQVSLWFLSFLFTSKNHHFQIRKRHALAGTRVQNVNTK